MTTIEGAGVQLHCVEHAPARGAAIDRTAIVVHGLASDAQQHAPAAEALAAAGIRTIAYDRRGYGESGAPEPYTATTADEQGNDLVALVASLGAAPALLVGDGFGALVVLDVVLRRPELVHAAVLSNIPLFAFVPAANALLAGQRSTIEDALRDGGPAAAVAAWLGGWAGSPSDAAVARAQRSFAGFFADYAGIASLSVTRRGLRAIATPLAVVTDRTAPAPFQEAADRLAELVPGAQRAHDGEVVALARLLA